MTSLRLPRSAMLKKFGAAAFLFFLAKGLLWLVLAWGLIAGAT